MTIEHRAAAAASITYEEFIAAVVAGRGDEAVDELRAVAAAEPNHFMLQQNNLQRAIVSLLFTWELGRETLSVVELMAERYPSPAAEQLLVESYVLAEDYPAAIECSRASSSRTRMPRPPERDLRRCAIARPGRLSAGFH